MLTILLGSAKLSFPGTTHPGGVSGSHRKGKGSPDRLWQAIIKVECGRWRRRRSPSSLPLSFLSNATEPPPTQPTPSSCLISSAVRSTRLVESHWTTLLQSYGANLPPSYFPGCIRRDLTCLPAYPNDSRVKGGAYMGVCEWRGLLSIIANDVTHHPRSLTHRHPALPSMREGHLHNYSLSSVVRNSSSLLFGLVRES